MYWKNILSDVFQLLYTISTFWLFINENSMVNAMYTLLAITALKSWNLNLPQ